MGDFLLDFRDVRTRREAARKAVSLLKYCDDTQVKVIERDAFTLVLGRVDQDELWGPCSWTGPQGEILVALAGRIALEETQWEASNTFEGIGGRACKVIGQWYRQEGLPALERLNGNYVVLVYDEPRREFLIVTDRCGMVLCYASDPVEQASVFGSHPDVVASAVDQEQNWDSTSLAQFVATGCLTYPYTYYAKVRAIPTASIHTLSLHDRSLAYAGRRPYFDFRFTANESDSEMGLAEMLGIAFQRAVRRRTLPIFGRTAIALSGGLDSRTILSAAAGGERVETFSVFDAENAEIKAARRIAETCDSKLRLFQRDFEFYGRSMESGVRISGAMGCIASNHFLGVRDWLRQQGYQNLLTGCYIDYLFKGLALNRAEQPLERTETLAAFQFEFYRPHYPLAPAHRAAVESRLRQRFPEHARDRLIPGEWHEVERKRTFPLAYEGDSAQRVIPQRVLPWYLPVADTDVLEVYQRIPPGFKLNASLFRKMMRFVCPKQILRIPDSNVGAPVNAGPIQHLFHRYCSAALNRFTSRVRPRLATRGSWPNWDFYIRHSTWIRDLWNPRNVAAEELFTDLLGSTGFRKEIADYRVSEVELFLRLLTLKIWLSQRTSISDR